MANTFLDRLIGMGSGGVGVGPLVGIGIGGIGLGHLSGELKHSSNSDKITSSVGLLGSNNADFVPNASIFDGINNSLTGNLDFQRELELLKQNQFFNADQARLQREFEEYLSSTAFSRQAEDLLKAGYNPALVLSNGGASTPTGYAASSSGSHSSHSSSVVNSLVNALVNLSVNSARSNEALSSARLLDEKAELIRETTNARNNYYNSRTRLNNEKSNNYSNESRAFTRNKHSYSDYYDEKTKILKRHNAIYERDDDDKKRAKRVTDAFSDMFDKRFKRR